MKTTLRFGRKLRTTRAQAMTEYIIIVSLVAIACLMVVGAFGRQIASLFKRSTDSLGTGQVQGVEQWDPNTYTNINEASSGQMAVGPVTVGGGSGS
ncbi:MAG: hypothetical protein HZA54_15365 [Planctomycetes bacterium]|nr:hypothetical protein [Planctomycetota bacterium]